MPGFNEPLLINIVGHAAGALIFAIFLALLFSGRGWSGARGRYLSGLAAALSLLWNVGSLVVLVFPGLPTSALNVVVAASFSLLSLLPAVLLHVWLEGAQKPLVVSGYILSMCAVAMHFWEIRGNGAALHQVALLVITIGFLVLTGAAVARRRGGGGRMAASMSLALFATSFVHFGSAHAVEAWSGELVVHHAGIPLALFVLLQDYRFVMLDAFVRFLANALLAAGLTWLMILAALRLGLVDRTAREPVAEALLLIGLCLFLVIFAWLRGRVLAWLTQAVFGHGRVSAVVGQLREGPGPDSPQRRRDTEENAEKTENAEEEYLEWAASLLADAVRARSFAVVGQSSVEAGGSMNGPALAGKTGEAIVPVRLMQGDSRLILLGPRQGGQRYLRDDLDSLASAAAEIVAHLESLRREELGRLVTQAELRALQSQINPHFLFNALNTLYGTIPREAGGARKMVLNLAEIFRYFLQSDKVLVPLAHELQIVHAYLEVEQCRLGNRLKVEFRVDDSVMQLPIPVLSIQPLVENAIKHGVAQRTEPGYVRISVCCEKEELRISVENSSAPGMRDEGGSGVGLKNVRRRLEICCGPSSKLELLFGDEVAVVELRIPLMKAVVH